MTVSSMDHGPIAIVITMIIMISTIQCQLSTVIGFGIEILGE